MTRHRSIELDQQDGTPPRSCGSTATITVGSEADLMAAYGLAARTARRSIVLDFSQLDYMNSGGIGLLVTLLVRAQRGGGSACSRSGCPITTARSSR